MNSPETLEKTRSISIDTPDRIRSDSSRARSSYIWGLLLISAALLLAASALFISEELVLALSISLASAIVIFRWPVIGLIGFIILNFIRPGDIVAGLDSLPLAKIIGGGTFLAVILKHLRSRDFLFRYRVTYLLVAFTVVIFASVPLSFWPTRAMEISLDFTKILLFFLIFVNVVRDWKTLKIVSLTALFCILILCYSTIASYLSGSIRAAASIGSGLFGDANDMALVLVTAIPLAGYLLMGNGRIWLRRLSFWAATAFLVTGIVVTQSRGGLLGMIVALLFLFARGRNKIKAIISLAIIGLLMLAFLPSQIGERYRTMGEYEQDAASMNRLYAWQAGLDMMASRPLNGVGIGCFETAFGTDFKPEGFNSKRWMAPHNTLVQVGAETGLIGLAIFIYMFAYCIFKLKRLHPAGTPAQIERISSSRNIILASMMGFAVSALFLTQALNYMLYFLIASTVCIHNINSHSARKSEVPNRE